MVGRDTGDMTAVGDMGESTFVLGGGIGERSGLPGDLTGDIGDGMASLLLTALGRLSRAAMFGLTRTRARRMIERCVDVYFDGDDGWRR